MELLKVMSEEVRIRLLILLQEEELMVGEIQHILKIKQSNLSTHLNILRQHGLLKSRKEGQKVFYQTTSLSGGRNSKIITEIINTSSQIKKFLDDRKLVREVIENRKIRSRKFFNEISRRDKGRTELATPGQVPEVFLMGFLQLIHNQRIADFGCGQGGLSRLLAEAGNHVVGIDNSEQQITIAKKINHIPLTTFVVGDIEATHLKPKSQDLVIICHSLHHTANPLKALGEAFRVLKSSGRLLIFDLDHHSEAQMEKKFGDFWMGFHNDELIKWLKDLGFRIVHNRIVEEIVYPVKKNLKKELNQVSKTVLPLVVIAKKP